MRHFQRWIALFLSMVLFSSVGLAQVPPMAADAVIAYAPHGDRKIVQFLRLVHNQNGMAENIELCDVQQNSCRYLLTTPAQSAQFADYLEKLAIKLQELKRSRDRRAPVVILGETAIDVGGPALLMTALLVTASYFMGLQEAKAAGSKLVFNWKYLLQETHEVISGFWGYQVLGILSMFSFTSRYYQFSRQTKAIAELHQQLQKGLPSLYYVDRPDFWKQIVEAVEELAQSTAAVP